MIVIEVKYTICKIFERIVSIDANEETYEMVEDEHGEKKRVLMDRVVFVRG